jgi:hypothetical protein
MELLLNLLWLTLALPAIWVWRHEPTRARHALSCSRVRASLLLLCVLTLLFPVVSATDDLHPLRSEIEESSPSKRLVKQSSCNSSATNLLHLDNFFARLSSDALVCPGNEICALTSLHSFVIPELVTGRQRASRAPPSPLLG